MPKPNLPPLGKSPAPSCNLSGKASEEFANPVVRKVRWHRMD